MPIEITPLPREQWQGHAFPFRYETAHYYDAEITTGPEGFCARFTKRPFERPEVRGGGAFDDQLYAPWWEGARAYGVLEGGELVACIELWKENWSNRLRVTELWVADSHHRRGIGTALMDFAKRQARELGCRALMLETQSGNENAVAFYLAQGLALFGFDRSAYTNRDVERRDVRLELGCYIE
ncbi:MAG: GNAT family N-acetyltransferase [Oscillospiraceae bacterium]|jgi:ribosomal protein S18 acetylase RimI-like enzyme|nr:GNAT family N-acetyltransferase [Oscillospiraceae bacterium]